MPKKDIIKANKNISELTLEDLLAVVDAEIDAHTLVGHHIDSFNSFISTGINQIVTQLFEIDKTLQNEREKTEEDQAIALINFRAKFTDVLVARPMASMHKSGKQNVLMPNMARRNDMNYSSLVTMDAVITAKAFFKDGSEPKVRTEEVKGFSVALPVMKGSEACHTVSLPYETRKNIEEDPKDPGGYFIIRGGEWVISMIESRLFNSPHIFRNIGHEKEIARLEFISKPGDAYENSSELIMRYVTNGNIYLTFTSNNYFKVLNIPFYIIFRLLGMTTDKEIIDSIVYGYSTKENKDVVSNYMLQVLKKAFRVGDPVFGNAVQITDQSKLLEYFSQQISLATQPKAFTSGAPELDENLVKYLNANILRLLDKHVFPHVGLSADTRHRKLRYLGHLIHKMLLVEMQIVPSTDRDSLKNKRINAAGRAYAKAFKTHFNLEVIQTIKKKLTKDFKSMPFSQVPLAQSFKSAIKAPDLEKALIQAITSGNKDVTVKNRQVPNRLASENLHRKNQLDFMAAMRVIRTPSTSASKQDLRADEMRRVHPSYTGFICPIQSASTGEPVGMIKQLSLAASISDASSSELLKETLLRDMNIFPLERVFSWQIHQYGLVKVLVNGDWIGCAKDAPQIVRHYREMRRGYQFAATNEFVYTGKPLIDPRTTIYWDTESNEITFWVDAGRMMRPLLIVRNNGELDSIGQKMIGTKYDAIADPPVERTDDDCIVKPGSFIQDLVLTRDDVQALYGKRLTIMDLHARGIIEYISPEEMENLLIASSIDVLKRHQTNPLLQYTHCDIPAALLGLPALTCPFASHNQGPRIVFQTNQGKQTCGWYTLNWAYRVDKHAFLQYYCESPIIKTLANKYLYPNGMNEINAIACYTGFNQEDSLVVNITSSERGMYKGNQLSFVKATLDKKEMFGNPDANNTMDINKHANYDHISNGFVKRFTMVGKDDVIIGKMVELSKPIDNYVYKDTSIVYHSSESAMIDDVIRGRNHEGEEIAKVKYSAVRQYGVGDKFCRLPTAEVLTVRGWIALKDIQSNDLVATLNHGRLVYDNIVALHKFDYDDVLYHISGSKLNFTCTPDHKLYTSTDPHGRLYSLVSAKELITDQAAFKERIYFQSHAVWDNTNKVAQPDYMRPYCSYTTMASGRRKRVMRYEKISQHNSYRGYNPALPVNEFGLHDCLDNLNIDMFTAFEILARWMVKGWTQSLANGVKWRLGDNYYQALVKDFKRIDAEISERSLPPWVWTLSTRHARYLLDEFQWAARKGLQSVNLANDIIRLALHAGCWATIDEKLKIHVHHYLPNSKDAVIALQHYTGTVMCLEVPTHVLYIRENMYSPPMWDGNSSRHGQKGMVALGVNQCDMMFSSMGLLPDKVLSPSAIPSRMTVGQLIEGVASKLAATEGFINDATIFHKVDNTAIGDGLEKHGYDRYGVERMYNGYTGEWIDTEIFISPIYYQRLQKFVVDEVYSISTGPSCIITRQPLEGKANNGGLRIGEMEKDVIISHGAGHFLMEKFRDDSDGFDVYICRTCGKTPVVNEANNIVICKTCAAAGMDSDVVKVRSTWASKLFLQELESANIGVRQSIEPYEYEEKI
jgi:DNA-directed RNA polymerase II subunit RPB2